MRELLERLPGELRLSKGGVRIELSYCDGKLCESPRVTFFRVPAKHAQALTRRGDPDLSVAEPLADALEIDFGHVALIAEYVPSEAGLALHNIDVSWHAA